MVQSLDPAGVGAVGQGLEGIKHCLLLQLDRDPGEYPLERLLIADHMQDIANNRYPQMAKATGHNLEEIKEAVEIVKSLDPLPGKEFEEAQNAFVKPEVIIEEVDGVFKVKVDESASPRVRVSSYYRELLEKSRKDPEIRKYLKANIDKAEWLLQAIHQRKSTLQRVAEEVVAHQQEFFRIGVRGLRPLKMQDIADIIGVNVSTVSRAISGKYFQAPGCIKDLKSLFTGGTVKDDGESESRDAVIMRIKDLIADENSKKPLSDAKIVARLAQDGIH
ncbi:MAG: RNA polymerase sigma-54 factor, partial [Planctomycetota bacterium]